MSFIRGQIVSCGSVTLFRVRHKHYCSGVECYSLLNLTTGVVTYSVPVEIIELAKD